MRSFTSKKYFTNKKKYFANFPFEEFARNITSRKNLGIGFFLQLESFLIDLHIKSFFWAFNFALFLQFCLRLIQMNLPFFQDYKGSYVFELNFHLQRN